MRKMIKYSGHFLLVLALCAMVVSGCSCSASKPAPNPLAGWYFESHNPNETIEEDYKNYIQNLPSEEGKYAGPIHYFADGTGQHAIMIAIGINNKVWRHVLIYNKDDKRIKVIKYISGDYRS